MQRVREVWRVLTPRRDDERGVVLVYSALFLFALLLMCGFAVDVANWYFISHRLQRAADAAALAGVTYLPGQPGDPAAPCPSTPHDAICAAKKAAAKNGYTSGITVAQDASNNRQLDVTIVQADVPSFFLHVIPGFSDPSFTRTAKAEFSRPIPLGSPENFFGTGNRPGFPARHFWAAINGYCTAKEQGDQFASAFDGNVANNTTGDYNTGSPGSCHAGTSAPGSPSPAPGTNTTYDPGGYTYDVNVPAGHGNISLDVFDPYFTAGSAGSLDSAYGRDSTGQLYARISTYFTVFQPDNNPYLGNGCNYEWANWGYGWGYRFNRNTSTSVVNQWYHLCTIPASAAPGTYWIRVTTTALDQSGNLDPTEHANHDMQSYGSNVFALFASATPETYSGSQPTSQMVTSLGQPCTSIPPPYVPDPGELYNPLCPSIAGEGGMSLKVTEASSTAVPYLARIDSADAGKPLDISLWDPGEGGSYIRILQPDGTPVPSFQYTAVGNTVNQPLTTVSGCSAPGFTGSGACLDVHAFSSPSPCPPNPTCVPAANNRYGAGKYNDAQIHIYFKIDGSHLNANDGWYKIAYTFPGPVSDRTTWDVSVVGLPAHLLPGLS